MADFADRLKELRAKENLSQVNLAKKVGVSRHAIYQWENRTRVPNAATVILFADYFNVTADYILGRTEY